MFGKFSEQMTKSAQPVANLFEMNAKTLGMMAEQQTQLFTGLMGDSVKLVESLTDQTDLKDMLAAQSVFAESIRERITGASKTTYKELTGISEEMMKGGLTTFETPQKEAVPASKATTASAPKKAVAKKPAATVSTKTATVENKQVTSNAPKAAAAESKVANKPAAKTVPKATPAAVKASVKK